MATQIVLSGVPKHPVPLWRQPLLVPAYLAAFSAFILALQLAWCTQTVKKTISRILRFEPSNSTPRDEDAHRKANANGDENTSPPASIFSETKRKIQQQGLIAFSLKALRALSCFSLLFITIVALILHESANPESGSLVYTLKRGWGSFGKEKSLQNRQQESVHYTGWTELALGVFYTYALLLSSLSLALRHPIRGVITTHLTILLFAVFGIYAYRDLWPLATFTLTPVDAAAGWFTWSRVGILGFASIILPLITPREYIPVDPKNPVGPSPEQTASPLSFMLFSFLDHIVLTAYKLPHLPYDKLPPLADYDYSSHLRATSFPKLDPALRVNKKPRHIFFGLMEQFRGEYFFLAATMGSRTILGFASPIGVNRLLNYIETRGENALVRPWVWIAVLFFTPLSISVLMQMYIFIATRILVRTEGILTQLVFEHSLRIRMKEETAMKTTKTGDDKSPTSGEEGAASSSSGPIASSSSTDGQKGSPAVTKASNAKKGSGGNKNLVGKINNLISSDLDNITSGRDFLFIALSSPLQITLCVWFLYTILGWSALVGMCVMFISFPIPGKIAQRAHAIQIERMKRTDTRVQTVTESMGVLRMVKMFGWETKVGDRIKEKREEELKSIKKKYYIDVLNSIVDYILPLLTMLSTYAMYTLVMGQPLTASTVQLFFFGVLCFMLHFIFFFTPRLISAKVSLDRVNEFLKTTELLDRHAELSENKAVPSEFTTPGTDTDAIGFHNATFTWSRTESGSAPTTPSERNFRLRIEGDLFFRKNQINLIVGPTGSGKTSLLLALLGELHLASPGPDSWFNLPRDQGVAFAAQEPWVLNETIKDNILFGEPYDADRYEKVLYQCALGRDLALFDAGDDTEVGEKGLTLSGGQKARVSLARAIYSKAETVLLDDVLSALDVHTARWVVEKCFLGDLLRGRTLILVTHNVAMTAPIAQYVVSVGSDGTISHGTVADILSHNEQLVLKLSEETEAVEKADELVDEKEPKQDSAKPAGKLIADEEIALGHVSGAALALYMSSMGGWGFWITFMSAFTASNALMIVQTWYLGLWASQYEVHPPEEVHVFHYLAVYAVILGVGVLSSTSGSLVYLFGGIRASRRIHEKLARSLLRTTLRFLDKTPTGRIIARFTKDIRAIDGPLTSSVQEWCKMSISLLLKLVTIVYMTPIFILPGLVFFVLGAMVGQIYMGAQLSIKREMSNSRAPLFSHFAAAIGGLTSIRAYGAEERFKSESLRRVDKYTRPARSFYNMNRWMSVRADALGGLFSAGLAAYLVYVRPASNASNTGLQINLAVSFTGMLIWWVRITNELEVQGNSLERIQGYIAIDQEPPTTESGKPPAYWPSSGKLAVKNLSARYAPEGPDILHGLSFDIKSGEKIGVVGRTGSGKSSLTLSLLRLIPTSGQVVFDGLPTETINLEALRGAITIIPQQPELLSGTIRQNLDPFDQHDDATLNDALRSAGLFSLQDGLAEDQRISLESTVSSGGGNFSVGQRQILALARALVRKSKVLILDEATASLDHRTDSLVQQSLSTEFKDCTLITVAHRLQTIMNSDKIIVLDEGHLVEFDSPSELLRKEGGAFKSLVDGSGDREALYALAAPTSK